MQRRHRTGAMHGARLVGGCCGTSPRTIAKLARRSGR
ncbi:MAG: homocysteine S-methyltransferase family protein [Planctomycetes bacterium]|nr:homocysteine S-methyltransferase family protein [Planctomycetota bacterium]